MENDTHAAIPSELHFGQRTGRWSTITIHELPKTWPCQVSDKTTQATKSELFITSSGNRVEARPDRPDNLAETMRAPLDPRLLNSFVYKGTSSVSISPVQADKEIITRRKQI
jgi:hypothetical protein